ncbi:aminotransferase class V-fold PLP-dependent enzyme [Streptacidiphilus sp. PB12-B1b]|uniref:aminotransferase class V-fold PLP-dependent enzyme n=1 Tax=Streptacidiphilus sp. PB12-B1b TaxID=2705012 RepID=UPI0015FC7313|nr:aminotransferase class V-fold PLP-dependent enzyme [Streptacidiphilus sp. PB12-B1b]QMU77758.1 aminotransferase class V-fold PLP-dependent enzyme [Streptacidiphilus sp. PB12-B1b]
MTGAARPAPLFAPSGLPARSDWSLDPAVLHLNHGSFGAVPTAAQRAQTAYRTAMEANPCAWFMDLTARIGAARAQIAEFLGADPGATALVPNASAGVSVVLDSLPTRPGMRIVTTDHCYGSVLTALERLARRCGSPVTAVHLPLDAGAEAAFAALAAELTDDVGLVVVDQITSPTGRELPAARLAAHARSMGIPVLVDAAHAPGQVARPLAGIEADFWVGNLHKFACAPRGTAALVASGPHAQALYPLIDSWGSELPFPSRFDQQGTADACAWLAAPTAFDTVERHYGWDAARAYITALADYAQELVTRELSEALGEDASAPTGTPAPGLRLVRLPAALVPDADAGYALRRELSEQLGIETAVTFWHGQGFLRLSAHVYNTAEDYEDFAGRGVRHLARLAALRRRGARR